ncbi:MAG: hypothetical protein AAFR73_05985 [Pseudomonadota bacterium]
MKAIKLFATLGVVGMLAACAQQEEPTLVAPEPVYNKFGDGGCEGGWIYVSGSVPEFDECVPPEECESVYDTAGNIIECIPESTRPDPSRDDGTGDGRRSPTGSTVGRT